MSESQDGTESRASSDASEQRPEGSGVPRGEVAVTGRKAKMID